MKYGIIFIIALAISADIPTEDGVLILGENNFDQAIKENEFLLVEFYAPWCGHCKKMAPEYAKAANTLAKENPPQKVAKVDTTIHKSLGIKYKIEGYPTIKLFINGEPQEYIGQRTENDFVNFMKKKTGPPSKSLNGVEDAEKFKESAPITLVLFGEYNDVYKKIARNYEDLSFGHCASKECLDKFKVKEGTIVMFKQFDEGRQDYTGEMKETNITSFIELYSPKLVMNFDEKAAQLIFADNNPGLFLLRDSKAANTAELDRVMNNVAAKLRGRIQAVATDIKEALEYRLSDYVGVTSKDFPTIRIFDTKSDLKKYVFQGDIIEANIVRFVEDWENNRLKPQISSQDVPITQNDDVYTLVTKTFDDVVMDPTKDVLVEFYAPWCQHCKKLAPLFEELANKLSHNPNLVIAKIDGSANDVEGITIQTFPTIKFWPANNKINPIDFNEERNLETFTKFLTVHGATSVKANKDEL